MRGDPAGDRDAAHLLMRATAATLLLLGAWVLFGCASAPRPDNRAFKAVGRLYYCYGPSWTWAPGATYADDACRPDPCGEMKMPDLACLRTGE